MNDIFHIACFIVWFVGFGMLMYGVFLEPEYDRYDTWKDFETAAKPMKDLRIVGGVLIAASFIVYYFIK